MQRNILYKINVVSSWSQELNIVKVKLHMHGFNTDIAQTKFETHSFFFLPKGKKNPMIFKQQGKEKWHFSIFQLHQANPLSHTYTCRADGETSTHHELSGVKCSLTRGLICQSHQGRIKMHYPLSTGSHSTVDSHPSNWHQVFILAFLDFILSKLNLCVLAVMYGGQRLQQVSSLLWMIPLGWPANDP